MSFLSGIYFPLSQLPEAAQTAAWFLPLAHAASLARGLTLGDPMPWPLISVAVLLVYGLVGLAISKRRVRQRLSR
jgi:lipooligosaccharide transport system permease protein